MLKRNEILEILEKAKHIDSRYELFGADKHKYRLNPPISASFVRSLEEKYEFSFPTDYFHFVTEIGDGGAGPDYGIYPLNDLIKKARTTRAEEYCVEYRNSLKNEFKPRLMKLDEIDNFIIASRKELEENPNDYFVYENADENAECISDGFYVLGTPGCYSDFGMAVTGEMRGKIFLTDNMGAYHILSDSFEEFYQNWLDNISDTEKLRKSLEERRRRLGKKTLFGYLPKF